MKVYTLLRSALVLLAVGGLAAGLAGWKYAEIEKAAAEAANVPEQPQFVTIATAQPHEYRRTTTSIGTVRALRSVTLSNELAGTVSEVKLVPGEIVEPGQLLVGLDVSVELAELAALEAQAELAETELARLQRLMEGQTASNIEFERAQAERDVAQAQIERLKAIIARKTIRAPFRARVGMADVHPGQFLESGTELTTLQGVDDEVHIDFTVPQRVAGALEAGDEVVVVVGNETEHTARIIAIDARVDMETRNAWVRARMDADAAPRPGASVRVRVPVGGLRTGVSIPVSALRKGPEGDHVFVLETDERGALRAHLRRVVVAAAMGDQVLVESGLKPGEQVAASGSFKLRDGALVLRADPGDTQLASQPAAASATAKERRPAGVTSGIVVTTEAAA